MDYLAQVKTYLYPLGEGEGGTRGTVRVLARDHSLINFPKLKPTPNGKFATHYPVITTITSFYFRFLIPVIKP